MIKSNEIFAWKRSYSINSFLILSYRRTRFVNWGVVTICNILLLWKKLCFQSCENTTQRLWDIYAKNEAVFFYFWNWVNKQNMPLKMKLKIMKRFFLHLFCSEICYYLLQINFKIFSIFKNEMRSYQQATFFRPGLDCRDLQGVCGWLVSYSHPHISELVTISVDNDLIN